MGKTKRYSIPFGGPWNEGRSSKVNSRAVINWMPRKEDAQSKSQLVLYPTPGLSSLGSGGTGGCRGDGVMLKGKGYFVNGNSLIQIDENNVFTTVGALDTVQGPVSMAVGFSNILIVDGVSGYVYDGTTFTKVTDADFPVAEWCTWSGQYFIVNQKGTSTFFISDNNNPLVWAALDQATAEKRADPIVRPIEFRGDLLLIGTETSELYFNSGNSVFPWEAYPNTIIEFGTTAAASVAIAGPLLFILAKVREGGYQVLQLASTTPQTISTKDIEWTISQMATKDDATGFAYQLDGHVIYQLTFPSEGRTFCYDAMAQLWHERTSYITKGSTKQGRHRAGGILYRGDDLIIGDYATGEFYTLNSTLLKDNGETIIRKCRAPVLENKRHSLFFARLEIEFETGVGLVDGSDPQVMLKWSDDGGHTYGNTLQASLGKQGDYHTRAIWYRLGAARERVFEVSISDPIEAVLIAAYVDVSVGID